jgi:hypothetical protein
MANSGDIAGERIRINSMDDTAENSDRHQMDDDVFTVDMSDETIEAAGSGPRGSVDSLMMPCTYRPCC